ncbi:MAG: hypothetical protein IJO62_04015 [Clostridia bacterium]|nr:hypothetical protein [Clostridia bacterium]
MTKRRNLTAFFVIGILGALGHFVYEWTGKPYVIGLFFPVNESTWEHLKLLFYPTVLYFGAVYFLSNKKPKSFIPASVFSVFLGMLSIVVMFYTYQGIMGRNLDFLNILIYYLGVIVTIITRQKLLEAEGIKSGFYTSISLISLIIMIILFATFSYNPPLLGIFTPPSLCS